MEAPPPKWDEVLTILSSLITFKHRADGKGWRDAFDNMPVYIERAGLTDSIKQLSVIHVAGTKGKGSTCACVESVLRSAGYRTGLFTSPHLVDVRERIRIGGRMVSREVFARNFWELYNSLNAAATPEVGVPGYFRFITLLGLKIFAEQGVDVAILEVGLGGRLDATNVVPHPVVCAITPLGMDHIELLGDTLPKIAAEKAGIMKAGCPVFSSAGQRPDAMAVLEDVALRVGCSLDVPAPLSQYRLAGGSSGSGVPLVSLAGSHQEVNAALAVQLARSWEERSGKANAGSAERLASLEQLVLPAEYAHGLAHVVWPGRGQILHDAEFLGASSRGSSRTASLTSSLSSATLPSLSSSTLPPPLESDSGSVDGGSASISGASVDGDAAPTVVRRASDGSGGSSVSSTGSSSRLCFFLDGAHTPESMVTCGQWFSEALAATAHDLPDVISPDGPQDVRVLIFNCMRERDGAKLLPPLADTLALNLVASFGHAIFVPPESQYSSLSASSNGGTAGAAGSSGSGVPSPALESAEVPDVSWQQDLRAVWEAQLAAGAAAARRPGAAGGGGWGGQTVMMAFPPVPGTLPSPPPGAVALSGATTVSHSLSGTLSWLRTAVRQSPRLRVQVLVTGSLYLVGDVLRLLGQAPQ